MGSPGGDIDVFPRASLGKGRGRGGQKLWASKEGHRTFGQVTVFFDVLPWVFWERVKFIYHLVYEAPLRSSLSDWPCVSGLCLLGVLNAWGSFIQLPGFPCTSCVCSHNRYCTGVCMCVCPRAHAHVRMLTCA